MEKYDYIYDNNTFTFFNINKYKIYKNNNIDIILKCNIEDKKLTIKKIYNNPFTIILFESLINKKKIILINTKLPYNKPNNEINNIINTQILNVVEISKADKTRYEKLLNNINDKKKHKKNIVNKSEKNFINNIKNIKNINLILETIRLYILTSRIFIAGNFERTIYSNKKKDLKDYIKRIKRNQ